MKTQIGVGKRTVTLEDFEKTSAVFIVGQNPGTNHLRMSGQPRAAHKPCARAVCGLTTGDAP